MTDRSGPITPPSFFKARLAIGAAAIVFCIGALIALSCYQSRWRYEEQARITTQNLARALETGMANTLDKANLALLHVVDEYAVQKAGGAMDPKAMATMIAKEKRHHPQLADLRLTDAQGNIRFNGDLRHEQHLSIADRDYFIRLRQTPGLGLTISKPLQSRLNGNWVVVLARSLIGPDGAFDGIVLATITVEELTRALAGLEIGKMGLTTLRDADMGLIARYPKLVDSTTVIGERNVSPQLGELVRSGQRAGSFYVVTPFDGVERFASYRRVGDYPLHIVVALAASDYLREWRFETLINGLLGALLATLTAALAWLLHHSRQRELATLETLRKQARSDSLTDLSNRRCFLELAEAELARTVRYGGALSMLMIDIDRFKVINDQYGHKSGDLVLQALAGLFRQTLREVDIIGRIGGEEFAVLLPATDGTQAVEVAERLRQIIAGAEVKLADSKKIGFTVSIGVASLGEQQVSVDSLLSLADRAMYLAKQQGRNKVCAA